MNDKLRELYEKVSGDESLKESFIKGLEAISSDDEKKDYVINFAKEQGVTLTEEDFPETGDKQELSDDDLDNVVGGLNYDEVKKECGDAAYIACLAAFGASGLYYIKDC